MLNPLICSVLVASSQEDPSGSHWNVMTYQGETKLEECEQKAGLKTCGDVSFSRNTVADPTNDVLHSFYSKISVGKNLARYIQNHSDMYVLYNQYVIYVLAPM